MCIFRFCWVLSCRAQLEAVRSENAALQERLKVLQQTVQNLEDESEKRRRVWLQVPGSDPLPVLEKSDPVRCSACRRRQQEMEEERETSREEEEQLHREVLTWPTCFGSVVRLSQ